MTYLLVGLGNPGPRYAKNRHNVGFMLLDALAARWGAPGFAEKFRGRFTKTRFEPHDVVLLAPLTFMNLSGEAVRPTMQFYDVPLEQVLVLHDELDLPFETLRLKAGGGLAGHNGLKSITAQCGGQGFLRLRVGIGRPPVGTVHDHVLSNFTADEAARLPDVLERGMAMVETVLRVGPEQAMNDLHGA